MGRAFPWGLSLGPGVVDAASFPLDERRRTYMIREKQKANTFVEDHCLARRGVLVPNAYGALGYRPVPIGEGSAAPSILLGVESCTDDNEYVLTHDDSDTASGLVIKWDQEFVSGDFRKSTRFILGPELNETSATEPFEIEAPHYSTGLSTESEVMQDARVLYSRYARPVKRMSVKPKWSMWRHLPGEVASVQLPVKDYASEQQFVGDLLTKMMVGSVTRNHNTREVSWDLVGFRELPQSITQAAEPPPDSFFQDSGFELNVVNGIAQSPNPLVLGRKYFTLVPTRLAPGFFDNVQGTGTFRIWSKETLLWGVAFDGTGLGSSGGAGSATGAGRPGSFGFVPARSPGGSVNVHVERFANSDGDPQRIILRRILSRPPAQQTGDAGTVVIPQSVNIENNRLLGAQRTLSGKGGAGGDVSEFTGITREGRDLSSDTTTIEGTNGGNGGVGVEIVAPVGSGFVGDGQIIVDGTDGGGAKSKEWRERGRGCWWCSRNGCCISL